MNIKDKIAVIGAGVSGLYMTHLLLKKGYSVELFEAHSEIGGRIKNGEFNGQQIDLGAQWLHQIDGKENLLTQILKEHKEEYHLERFDFAENNEHKQPEIVQDFYTYLSTQVFDEDQPLSKTIAAFSKDPKLLHFMEAILVDMAASSETFSTIEFTKLSKQISPDDYALNNTTMSEFVQAYFSKIPKRIIHLSTPINQIKYSENQVELIDNSGTSLFFNKVIVSVPISQLQQNKILFTPSLSTEKLDAIHSIGMGKGLKVFLFFREKMSVKNTAYELQFAPYYALGAETENNYQLITLIMGKYAENYYKDPILYQEKMIQEIAQISGKNASNLFLGSVFQDWTNEDYIQGTYSYPKPGDLGKREIAAQPVMNTVFFIGEAMNTSMHYGFIQGAMETAVHVNHLL